MDRKIRVISNELTNRKLKLEEFLEKLMNSDERIGDIENLIINTLKEMAEIESVIQVWNNLIVEITKTNNQEKNGTI